MRAGNGSIAVVAIASALLSAEIAGPSVVRVTSALLLLFVLPGLAVSRALFAERPPNGWEMVLLSVALSVALAVVGGLILHLTPFGLTGRSWAAYLGLVTVVAAGIAEARGSTRTLGGGEVRTIPRVGPRSISRKWVINGALLGLALGLVVSAMAVARTPLPARGVEGYTGLWLLPAREGNRYLDLGVQSSELETTRYRLEVRVGPTRVSPYRFELPTGGRWSTSLRVEPGFVGTVRALLYRSTEPDRIYRRVRLLVDARDPANRR